MSVDPSTLFTDRVLHVLQLAKVAAESSMQDVGSEHVLLALIEEGKGVAASVLKILDINTKRLAAEAKRLGSVSPTDLQSKNELSLILEQAMEESTALGHHYVGTEHLLLSLLAYREGLAASILKDFGIGFDAVRQEIRNLLGPSL